MTGGILCEHCGRQGWNGTCARGPYRLCFDCREAYRETKFKRRNPKDQYYCWDCKQYLPAKTFNARKSTCTGLAECCRPCSLTARKRRAAV